MAAGGVSGFVRYAGPAWRAAARGKAASVLDGTKRAGRYNRPGEAALYMSGSPEGVAAAMVRYGETERDVVPLAVVADRLIDLRDVAACAALGIDAGPAREDWIAAIDAGEEPASWAVADRARALGAAGLIDGSRRAPGLWHLVLFAWNEASAASVEVAGAARE